MILVMLSSSIAAQSVIIKGRVTDTDRSPVELAQVRIEGKPVGATGNLKGHYRFTCETADTVVVVFSMIGYETVKRTLFIMIFSA